MAKASERCRRGESSKEQFLFIPFNLSNRHWTLLFVNLKTKTLHILDLLKQHTDADLANKVSIITNIILDKIFGYSKGLKVWRIFHKMMFFSCGKLSCYYASHILLNLQWFIGLSFHNDVRKTVPISQRCSHVNYIIINIWSL